MLIEEYGKIFGKILSTIEEGVHAVDSKGNALVYNRAMAQMEKMEVKEVLEKPFHEVFHNIPEQESTLLQALTHGTAIKGKYQTYINYYGQEVTTVNTTVPVIYQNQIIGAVEIATKAGEQEENVYYDYEMMSMKEYLNEKERKIIRTALKICNGNISKTAEKLKTKRQTLQYKIEKYGLLSFCAQTRVPRSH